MSNNAFIQPLWPKLSSIGAVMTTRLQGMSQKPFDSFNVGNNTGDNPATVAENQQLLKDWIKKENNHHDVQLVFLQQVHGSEIINLDQPEIYAKVAQGIQLQADGALSTTPGLVCIVRVADCIPVLFSAPGVVAAVHAGWRGLCSGILEKTVETIQQKMKCQVSQINAWLGPCICAQAYEVGSDLRDAFVKKDKDNAIAFISSHYADKWLADLPLLAQQILQRKGLNHIFCDGRCTYSNERLFFSYRRDVPLWGDTGRMAACIWIKHEAKQAS